MIFILNYVIHCFRYLFNILFLSQQQQQHIPKFVIQSKIDNKKFTVDKKVMESSTLLKNISDITDITEPVMINCSGHSLRVYIILIHHYQTIEGNDVKHDKNFEKNLFESATAKNKQKLSKLFQDLSFLDSDFFLNSAADYILEKFEEEKMDWFHIKEFLGLENDFNRRERKLLLGDEKFEYFLSINTENFKFPFENKNFYLLKTDFSTPLNALIARIVERSNARASFLLSLINKTLKNEVDRHPFKLTKFSANSQCWYPEIYFKNLRRGFTFYLSCQKYDDKYFNILKKRKILAEKVEFDFGQDILKHEFPECKSADFPISKKIEVTFRKTYKSMYQFDTTKYKCSTISYSFSSVKEKKVDFEEIYNHLIANDLSKEIQLQSNHQIFKFFGPNTFLRFRKKQNASKFYKLEMLWHKTIYPEFKEFVKNYMENDGTLESSNIISGIPVKVAKIFGNYIYPISVIKKYLEFI